MKCRSCGLNLATHTDEKCMKVLCLEREVLLGALEQAVDLLGKTTRTLRTVVKWVKNHKAHETLKLEEHQSAKR